MNLQRLAFLVLLVCGRNDVFVVTVPGEPKSVVRPGGFSVKALLRSHDLGHSAPMSIDLSPWYRLPAVEVKGGDVAVDTR